MPGRVCLLVPASHFRSYRDALVYVMWFRLQDEITEAPCRRSAAGAPQSARDKLDDALITQLAEAFKVVYDTEYSKHSPSVALVGDSDLTDDSPFKDVARKRSVGELKKKMSQSGAARKRQATSSVATGQSTPSTPVTAASSSAASARISGPVIAVVPPTLEAVATGVAAAPAGAASASAGAGAAATVASGAVGAGAV